jgi:predicted RNase H-like HicB family nuclease
MTMGTARYIYWKDAEHWLGYFEEYQDYVTQGESLEDPQENLRDLHRDLTSGEISGIRRVADLTLA